jgi:hypothetical protein
MFTYKLHKNIRTGEINCVFRTDENGSAWCIPFDPQNSDYIAYLAWVKAGGVPIPADEATE